MKKMMVALAVILTGMLTAEAQETVYYKYMGSVNEVTRDTTDRGYSGWYISFAADKSTCVFSTKEGAVTGVQLPFQHIGYLAGQHVYCQLLQPIGEGRVDAGDLMFFSADYSQASYKPAMVTTDADEYRLLQRAADADEPAEAAPTLPRGFGQPIMSVEDARKMSVGKAAGEPLVVVDGKPVDMPVGVSVAKVKKLNEKQMARLLSMKAKKISAITVLKDDAAKAIWGERGANGVIEVTTRRHVGKNK